MNLLKYICGFVLVLYQFNTVICIVNFLFMAHLKQDKTNLKKENTMEAIRKYLILKKNFHIIGKREFDEYFRMYPLENIGKNFKHLN